MHILLYSLRSQILFQKLSINPSIKRKYISKTGMKIAIIRFEHCMATHVHSNEA